MFYAPTVADFARRYCETRDLSQMYAATLQRRAAALQLFAGDATLAGAFSEPVVNSFLASLDSRRPYTVKGYRGDILSLWNAAADDDLVPYPVVRRIRRPRIPALNVECYTVDEARLLLAEADNLRGCYADGTPRRRYWQGAIPLAWDAGFRRGDVWRFTRDAVRPDKTIRIIQHKTDNAVRIRLRDATLAALDAIGKRNPCEWLHATRTFCDHFTILVERSGVKRGTFKWLRRGSGSYVEAQQPGAGPKHLGHADARTFYKHYDAQIGELNAPMPPEL